MIFKIGMCIYNDKNKTICKKLKLVKKIFCLFRYSPVRNSILQNHVRNEFERAYKLLLNIKIRWNSIATALMKRHYPAAIMQYSEAEVEILCEESEVIVETDVELAKERNSYIL